jgi:hypothetical protein
LDKHPPLQIGLQVGSGIIPALVDTGSQFSCVRSDVLEFLKCSDVYCKSSPCDVSCILANGSVCRVEEKVSLHAKLSGFSWDHDFKVLNVAPFPLILGLGLDFISRTRMVLDMDVQEFYFAFALEHRSKFQKGNVQLSGMNPKMSDYCSQLLTEILNHPLNIMRGRFGFQNSLSVHNITWLGQGTFTYERPSYLKKKTIMIYSGKNNSIPQICLLQQLFF